MRFILPAIALLFLGFLGFSYADLRYASTPKNNFAVRNREASIAFKAKTALYMEPSTFGYQGLLNQKQNNYDNFLRSNIDNEQDFRNFNTEKGKDHLPFRTLEGRSTDATNQLPSALIVDPGQEYVLPLRMNQPHAYEIELNIWINENTIVVPIKKPVCVGEGYGDAVLPFRIPDDFNDLGAKVQGFNGCQKIGDCVLQMYAHSVEPRAYAAGTPIIVRGWDSSKATATDNSQVQPATVDPGTDLSKLSNDVCAVARLTFTWSAVPRRARHVSDVYNHAYQNSDYSPYSGQQHEAISKNLQAACILRMVNANRGELGQSILTQQQKNVLSALRNTADNIVKNYETITNRILTQVFWGDKTYDEVGRSMPDGPQPLNSCYRCAESSSVSANRIQMYTAIPSFDMQYPGRISEAQQLIQQINPKYSNLINNKGIIQIYVQALSDMSPLYSQLQSKYGLSYQPAMTKPSIATMADATGFRKMNANGFADGGKYAATQAKAAREARDGFGNNIIYNFDTSGSSLLNGITIDNLSGTEIELLTIPNSTPLSPNDDDNPSKQSGYSDSEDVIEASPINNDSSLPYPTSDTSGTTYTSSTNPSTPSTTPIHTSYRNTLPISTTGIPSACLSASLSSNNNNNNYFYGSGGIIIPIIIGVVGVVVGIIIGFILSVIYQRRKNEVRQEAINNVHTAV